MLDRYELWGWGGGGCGGGGLDEVGTSLNHQPPIYMYTFYFV